MGTVLVAMTSIAEVVARARTVVAVREGAAAVLAGVDDPELTRAIDTIAAEAVARIETEEREARFRRLTDPLADSVWVYDYTTKRYVYANDKLGAARGYSSDEMLASADTMWGASSAEFIRRVIGARHDAYRDGERRRYTDEFAQTCRDGSVVWTETVTFFAEDPVTGHLLVCGSSRPLRRSEGSSGEAPALVDDLQRLGSIGAWSFDPVSGDARWTDEVARIHECDTFEDVKTQLDPADDARMKACFTEAMRTGERFAVETAITTPSGIHKWIRLSGQPVVEHGVPIRMRGTTQDITDRKLVELALAAEQAQMQCLLDALPDVIALKDREGRVLAANARVEEAFGVPRGGLIGKKINDYAPREMAEIYDAVDRKVMQEDCVVTGEGILPFRSDGHEELCEIRTSPVRGATGEVIGTLRIARDVTAARAAVEKARETETQLRAVQKMEAVGRLAGGVAHDFNNLLSVILSYTSLVVESLPAEHALQEDLAEILGAGKRAEALTRQLLAFSRRQLLQPAPLVLDDVVDTIGNMLLRLIGEDIRLRITHSDDLHATRSDRGQIEQVIMNLVVNARDAMPDGGTITVATSNARIDEKRSVALEVPPGEFVELAVTDTGSGMDAATMARIFEPFFTTKGDGKGTGLGLAMAYGIVKQSGGAVEVESELGAGTTIRIFLPRHEGSVCAPKQTPSRRGKSRGHETVLVVEDEAGLRTVVRRILNRAGYKVLLAANAQEALAIAQETGARIDLVFTDVVMPGMNGGELVDRLGPTCPRMKVIFTSGYTDEKLARIGVGNNCFIPKPYHPAQLTDAIRAVLDGTVPTRWRTESVVPMSLGGPPVSA